MLKKILSEPIFINTANDLQGIKKNGSEYIAGSGYVFVTMKDTLDPGDPFKPFGKLAATLLPWNRGKKLNVWVDDRLLEAQKTTGAKMTLLHSYYLRFGLVLPGTTIIYGGGPVSTGTNLEYFVFHNGTLLRNGEYSLPPVDSKRFLDELEQKIKETIPEGKPRILYCPPLPENPEIDAILQKHRVKRTGSKIFALPSFSKVTKEKKSPIRKVVAGTVVLSIAGFALPVWSGWSEYSSALSKWQQEIQGYDEMYAEGSQRLDMLETQRFFLEEKEVGQLASDDARLLLRAVSALDNARVEQLEFKVGDKEKTPYTLGIELPAQKDMRLLEQAREAMDDIVESAGGEASLEDFRVGSRRVGDEVQERRGLVIEGQVYPQEN